MDNKLTQNRIFELACKCDQSGPHALHLQLPCLVITLDGDKPRNSKLIYVNDRDRCHKKKNNKGVRLIEVLCEKK